MSVSCCFSVSVKKNPDQNHLGKGRASFHFQFTTERSQGKNLRQEPGSRDSIRDHGGWCSPVSVTVVYIPSPHAKGWYCQQWICGFGLWTSISNQENAPTITRIGYYHGKRSETEILFFPDVPRWWLKLTMTVPSIFPLEPSRNQLLPYTLFWSKMSAYLGICR